jgi:hypothetical protein
MTTPRELALATALAPVRARYQALIAMAASWSLASGAALHSGGLVLVLAAAERDDALGPWTRPRVNQLLMGDIPNWCSTRGALLPEDVPELVWGFLDFLSATGRLAEGSDPLERLREPLMCYGGLDAGGRPRPANQPASFPCECYLPVAPTSDPAASWWRTGDGQVMEMRRPRPDESELFAWWGALVRFAQVVHEEQIPWPVMIGEFSFVGHVVQALGRDVWVYLHTRSKREVFVDADGQAYRLHPDRRTKAGARFVACSPRAAMYSAALPAVVDAVSYEPETARDWPCSGPSRTAIGYFWTDGQRGARTS